ncbi:MAG: hypothetical protein CSA22_02450 [Deltaproteobacteria bacterium]|nr:MAG: hypothetical protein CSA22_02450 [Deltaproteobacteria bacterium]
MNRQLLIFRIIIAMFFGVLLMRFYYPDAHPAFSLALIGLLVELGYLSEYLHNRRKKQSSPAQTAEQTIADSNDQGAH